MPTSGGGLDGEMQRKHLEGGFGGGFGGAILLRIGAKETKDRIGYFVLMETAV